MGSPGPFPLPLPSVPNITQRAHSQDRKHLEERSRGRPKYRPRFQCRLNVTSRAAPSTNSSKSVDPRLRSFAPPGHPYAKRRVNADGRRCPPDLFPFGAYHLSRWFPSLHVVSHPADHYKSDHPRSIHLKVSIRLKLGPTTRVGPTPMRSLTFSDRFALLS